MDNELPADSDLADIAAHCSLTERRAESAEREVARQLTAEFMQKKIGLRFAGAISGVTEFGVFVQLNDFPIDGLIHIPDNPGLGLDPDPKFIEKYRLDNN